MTTPTQGLGIGSRPRSQPDDRGFGKWVDQHGRSWYATTEKATGHPAAPLRPLHWTAPVTPYWARARFQPDAKYLVLDSGGAHDRMIDINYPAWLTDWDEAERERLNLLRQLVANSAQSSDGAPGVDAQTLERWQDNPPKHILAAVGPGPAKRIPREFIEAMSTGNKWALGLTDRVPSWAAPILERWERLQDAVPGALGARSDRTYFDADDEEAAVDLAADLDDAHEAPREKRAGKPPKRALAAHGG